MVLSVKCMTKPDESKYAIPREAYHRIRDAFDEHGIRFADRNVRIGMPIEPNQPPKAALDLPKVVSTVLHQTEFETPDNR